jgi:hypothetical protein
VNILFYTRNNRPGVVAAFELRFPAGDRGQWTHASRGEIIHSTRDGGLAVVWPRAKGGFCPGSPLLPSDTSVANEWILHRYTTWMAMPARGAA